MFLGSSPNDLVPSAAWKQGWFDTLQHTPMAVAQRKCDQCGGLPRRAGSPAAPAFTRPACGMEAALATSNAPGEMTSPHHIPGLHEIVAASPHHIVRDGSKLLFLGSLPHAE